MQNILSSIQISLPSKTFTPLSTFINLFENTTKTQKHINFNSSPSGYLPKITLNFADDTNNTFVIFLSDNVELMKLTLVNEAGEQWNSPYNYKHITLDTLVSRLSDKQIHFQYYDHLGINMPWRNGIHPKLQNLISTLKPHTLLHSFPENKDWYFILPGSIQEISRETIVDYKVDRKPKFEFVNFKNCSIPILQIDLATNAKYEKLKNLFPEAIHDDKLRNLWVYLKNSSGIDICLVLGETNQGWTDFFTNSLMA